MNILCSNIPRQVKDRWRQLGKYFGYPQCCIDYFCTRKDLTLTDKQMEVIDNEGFVPCPSCAEKVTKETLSTLITDRQCPTSYPIES